MNRKHPLFTLFILLAVSAGLWAAEQQTAIAPEKIKAHVEYLASPAMKGRGTGTPELNKAANYIAKEFKRDGLEPLVGSSFFQKFRVTVGAELGKQNSATLMRGTDKTAFKVTSDWQPLNFSDSGAAAVPLAFAGFGITAPEYSYDDYTHMDVNGKAVIVLRQEPQKDDEKSKFEGKTPTQYSQIVNKAINARNHGAKVMVLVNDLPGQGEEDFLMKFGSLTGPENAGILLLQAKRDVVDKWLAPSGKSLTQLQKDIDDKLEPQSYAVPDATLDLRVDVRRITAETQNVVGVLRGRDPKLAEEAVVIGAHYDHLGLGEKNSLAPSQAGKVHAGADDNASGTSVLLELARALGERKRDLRRSIVFLAFSGEELGLLGSAYYTKNPQWPLEKTAAMINLDMVGRPKDGKLVIGGIGSSPGFKEMIEKSNRTGLKVSTTAGAFGGSSDHISFYVKNVPVLFFFSGLHADYHKPSDTPDKILPAEAARVGDLAMQAALTLSSQDARPLFVRVQEAQPAAGGGGAGYGAYFGSIPDMGEEVVGVKFADVRDGSPAQKAGLKAGDILVDFAGKEIKNLYDFTYALRAHKPGEEINVTVLRGKEKLVVKVKLEQRR
ncbi:MAG: M20/M25/M40 family metallo-hydrolase [Acidobacteria bacterium]|nr:M20/M25/M40 family metallo-hydrolase [Acidobacteriota bacterium]MCL5289386.1 M20/M25/M40 family metallo-hydrolase [Acidobacteriota bacterium]